VRNVIDRLSLLSEPEMRALSAQFADEARKLPEKEREQLRKVLEEGLLPVPPDLNYMLVVAIAEIPRPPAEPALAEQQDGGAAKPPAEPKPQARDGSGEARIAAVNALPVKPGNTNDAVAAPAAGGAEAAPSAQTAAAGESRSDPVGVW
jgi:hypothetical protein